MTLADIPTDIGLQPSGLNTSAGSDGYEKDPAPDRHSRWPWPVAITPRQAAGGSAWLRPATTLPPLVERVVGGFLAHRSTLDAQLQEVIPCLTDERARL